MSEKQFNSLSPHLTEKEAGHAAVGQKNRRPADGVEELEFYVPLMRLQEEGADVLAAGPEVKTIQGKNGLSITPDIRLDALRSEELAAVIVPGGWAPDKLRREPQVIRLIREMDAARKTLGFICHGGLVAISAGIVRGRKATGSLGIKDDLENTGASWVDGR